MTITVKDFAKTLKISNEALLQRMQKAGLSHAKGSDEITPADITDDQKAQIQSTGISAYKLLGCRGMVRLDYILVDGNKPAILEVNSVPGFSKMSILPQQLAHCGISINEILTRVLNQCSN